MLDQAKDQETNNAVIGTTIWIPLSLKETLDNAKLHPREPYYQVIERVFGGLVNGSSR